MLIALGCISFFACKKDSNSTQGITKPIYDFTYSGKPQAGDTLNFTSTAPLGSTYLWDFGDGFSFSQSATSSTASPTHEYQNPGSYIVSLSINNDSINAIKKTINIAVDSGFAGLVCGSRSWTFTHIFDDGSGFWLDTMANKVTINANILFRGKNKVMVSSDSARYADLMTYDPLNSNDTILVFTGSSPVMASLTSYSTLQYNLRNHVIRFYNQVPNCLMLDSREFISK